MGEHDESLSCFTEALRIFKLDSGNNDTNVSLVLNNLGINHARRKNYAKAIELCTEGLRIRRLQGSSETEIADSLFNIGHILDEWGKDEQAMKFYTEALQLYRKSLGDEDIEVANCLQYLAAIYTRNESLDKAIPCYTEALRLYRLKHGNENLDVASTLYQLGRVHGKRAEYDKALKCFTECLQIRRDQLGDDDLDVIAARRFADAIRIKLQR